MKTLRALTATLLCILIPSSPVLSQIPAQDVEVIVMPGGGTVLQWHGHTGRTYFIQGSDPNDHHKDWIWSPYIEYGNDEAISHEVGSTAEKGFFRLHYTDTPPPAAVTLEQWDADGDGLPNALELDIQTHPLNSDTSGDGIPDGWAYVHGLDPRAHNAIGLFQGGPATNLEAYQQGVQADPDATIDDHDADGVNNDVDADPQDADVDWKPAMVGGYALIEIDVPEEAGYVRDFNDAGHVLFDGGVWNAGVWTELEQVEIDGSFQVEEYEFTYASTANSGWKLSPVGDVMEMGSFTVTGGPGDVDQMSHVLRRSYQPQTTSYQSAVSTLHTLDWQGEDYGWKSLQVLGEDENRRVFASKWIYTAPPGETEPEISILDSNLVQTGSYAVPEGYNLYLHGNQVTPSGWLAVNASPYSESGQPARTIVWNPAGQEITTSGGLPWFFTGLTELPHDKPALACRHHGSNGLVFLLNENGDAFKTAAKLGGKGIHTFAGDGTAITSDNKMWINGKLVPLRDICPAYGDLLDEGWSFQIHKANSHGSYLIEAHNSSGSRPHMLVPLEINSLDRFVRGSIDLDIVDTLFGGLEQFGIQIEAVDSGHVYGDISLSDAYIHEEDFLNSDSEAAQSLAELPYESWQQNVIYYQKDSRLYFMTTVGQVDDLEIRLYKNGQSQATLDYSLTAITEVSNLIDELDRTFGQMPFANGGEIPPQYIVEAMGPEYDDIEPETSVGEPLGEPLPLNQLNEGPFDSIAWRNLTTRCMEALFEELEKKIPIVGGQIAEASEVTLKRTVAYASGYLRGLWGGLKSDWDGIVELKDLLLHPVDTSKAIYEGFKELLGLNLDQWEQIAKHMFDSMISSAQQGLPWVYKGDNLADQLALISHIHGYGAGFVSEQVLMVMVGAGVVSKVGQTVKGIIAASKAGQLATQLLANGLQNAANLARRVKTASLRWWSRYADDEFDLQRIAASNEGAYRNPDTAGYDSSFLNAHRGTAEGLDQLDDMLVNSKILQEELGPEAVFKDLDTLDNLGRSHVGQYLRRLGQISNTLHKAGALSEDALIGYARLYRRLVKNADAEGGGFIIHERTRDLAKLFDTKLVNLDGTLSAQDIKGAKALAKSLEDYKINVEANPDAKFWFRDVETVYETGYKYVTWQPDASWDGNIASATWCTPKQISSPELANDLLLLPAPSKNPNFRIEFDIVQCKDRCRVPVGRGEADPVKALEPVTRDIPEGPDAWTSSGTGEIGGAPQLFVEGGIQAKRVVNLTTGEIVWQKN